MLAIVAAIALAGVVVLLSVMDVQLIADMPLAHCELRAGRNGPGVAGRGRSYRALRWPWSGWSPGA